MCGRAPQLMLYQILVPARAVGIKCHYMVLRTELSDSGTPTIFSSHLRAHEWLLLEKS